MPPVNFGGPGSGGGAGPNPADEAERLAAAFDLMSQTLDLLNRQHVHQWRLQNALQQQVTQQLVPALTGLVKAFTDATSAVQAAGAAAASGGAGGAGSSGGGLTGSLGKGPPKNPIKGVLTGKDDEEETKIPGVDRTPRWVRNIGSAMQQLEAQTVQMSVIMTAAISSMSNPITSLVQTFDPGAVYRFELAFRNLQAHMGQALRPVLERLTEIVRSMSAWLAGLNPEAQRLVTGLAGMAAAMTAVGVAMHLIALASGGLLQVAGMVAGALVGMGVSFGDFGGVGKAVGDVMRMLGQVFNTVAKAAEPLMAAVGDVVGEIVGVMAEQFQQWAPVIAGVLEMLAVHVRELAPTFARLFKVLADIMGEKELLMFQLIAASIDAVLTAFEVLLAVLDPFIVAMEAGAAAVKAIVQEIRKLPGIGRFIKDMDEFKPEEKQIAAMPARAGSIEGIGQGNRIASFSMSPMETPEVKATREEAEKTRGVLGEIKGLVAAGSGGILGALNKAF